jgi:nucleoside 2-deoxyribosyltransferase
MGILPTITADNLDVLRTLPKPNFLERAEKFLLMAVARSPRLGNAFNAKGDELTGASYSDDWQETATIRQYLESEKLIERQKNTEWRVTPAGHIRADELRAKRAASTQGFVAMWFHEDLVPVYENGFGPAIRAAGYQPMIINKKEHSNKIDDEIIAEIRRSAFLVGDFTGHRGGVYFEAGYAMGRGLPVFWTCRKDNLKDLHFDVRQYNCIDWIGPDDLRPRLQQRIEALLGRGPLG